MSGPARSMPAWGAATADPSDPCAPGRALESCRAAMDARPDDPINHYKLAGAYALLGRKDEALV